MESKFRCDCPITSALDLLGDKWVLVIVKLMLLEDKHTFKDFLASDEAIATNILSTKLKWLEEWDMLTKTKLPNNKKTNLYFLTDKGLALVPVIIELALWSDGHLREDNPIIRKDPELEIMKTDRAGFIHMVQDKYREKRRIMLS